MKRNFLAGIRPVLLFLCSFLVVGGLLAQAPEAPRRHEAGLSLLVGPANFEPWLSYKLALGSQQKSALRARLFGRYRHTGQDAPGTGDCANDRVTENRNSALTLALGWEYRLRVEKTTFYFGADLEGTFSNSRTISDDFQEDCPFGRDVSTHAEDVYRTNSAAVRPFAGLRFRPTERWSVSVEVGLPVVRSQTDREETRMSVTRENGQVVDEDNWERNRTTKQTRFVVNSGLLLTVGVAL